MQKERKKNKKLVLPATTLDQKFYQVFIKVLCFQLIG